jgi:hypothetical protein
VLGRTLGHVAGINETYRPYQWRQNSQTMNVIFRDHYLSDLVGFVYSRMNAEEAAGHFMDRIRENCSGILARGADALVPIILDGENAWEHYELSGRPFLGALYNRLEDDSQIHALTVSEALARVEPAPLSKIFPGSWINSNFDIWIGAEEDNRAWELLLRARQTYEGTKDEGAISPEMRKLAFEELLIAEGSDWCWWYGPEHHTDNAAEFDMLYRGHLANVYHALGRKAPEELSRPIRRTAIAATHQEPTAPVRAIIDGEVTSYFEWLGSGLYKVDGRSSSMHGQQFLFKELRYGSDGLNLYLRIDLEPVEQPLELQMQFEHAACRISIEPGKATILDAPAGAETAHQRVIEARFPLAGLGVKRGQVVRLALSLWNGALPVDALPQDGMLSLITADPADWPV